MAREVRHDADGPAVLTEEDIHPEKGDIAVCRCGLSPEFPLCDGSHRATRDEDEDTRYCYPAGPDGGRRVVTDLRTTDVGSSAGDSADGSAGDDCPEADTAAITPDVLPGVPGDSAGGSRLVNHDARSPAILDPEDLAESGGERRVCRCGLSDDRPFCDGSHAITASESPEVVSRYDGETRRTVVTLEITDETDD
jgi:CDGSH-type Zn-finger protein